MTSKPQAIVFDFDPRNLVPIRPTKHVAMILSVVPLLFAFLPGLGKHKKRKWGRFLSASYSSWPLERPCLWPGHRPPTKGSAKYTSFDVLSSPIHLPRSFISYTNPAPDFVYKVHWNQHQQQGHHSRNYPRCLRQKQAYIRIMLVTYTGIHLLRSATSIIPS